MDPSQVIIRPVVSEKSYVLATADKYTFRVHPDAHKTQISRRSRRCSTSTCVDVRTTKVPSKPKRRGYTPGARGRGRRPSCRCAPGDTIPIFQGLEA